MALILRSCLCQIDEQNCIFINKNCPVHINATIGGNHCSCVCIEQIGNWVEGSRIIIADFFCPVHKDKFVLLASINDQFKQYKKITLKYFNNINWDQLEKESKKTQTRLEMIEQE